MYDLASIEKLNDRAARKANNPGRFVEHCSYTGTIENGLVLHSAKQRSTVMIKGAVAKQFVRDWRDIPAKLGGNKHAIEIVRDQLVESLF
jgi:hypothetical protein